MFSENRLSQFLFLTENCTFAEWIDKLKLEEAKRLLSKHPRLTVRQVEERIGYRISYLLLNGSKAKPERLPRAGLYRIIDNFRRWQVIPCVILFVAHDSCHRI